MPKTAPACARFAIHGTWTNARDVVNIYEALVVGDLSGTRSEELQAYAEILSNSWVTNVMPNMSNNYIHDRVDWVDLNSASGPTGTFTRAVSVPGGNAGSSMGPQSALRATKNLIGAARGSRSGRTFLVGPEEANVDEDGIVNAATVATRQSDLNDFLAGATIVVPIAPIAAANVVVIQWPSITVTQPSKKVTDPDGVGDPVQVISFTVDRFISSQKRRLGAT